MGTRAHGTWAQLHEDVHDHAKTLALASGLVALGVPEPWSVAEAVKQLHLLACWAIRDGITGRVGHLTPTRFAMIVRWPKGKHDKLIAAWNASGFIDKPGTPDASIHDFGDYFWHVIRKRSPGAYPAPDGRRTGAEDPHENDHLRRRPGGKTRSHARPRARGPETEHRTSEHTPPPLSGPDLAHDDPVCVSASPCSAQTPSAAPDDDTGPCGDPALHRAWNAARARLVPPRQAQPLTGDHTTAYVELRHATGEDEALAVAVIDAFHADGDDMLQKSGWSVKVFPFRIDGLLGDAAKRVERRNAAARPKPPPEPEAPIEPPEVHAAAMTQILAALRGKANA